MSLPEPIDLETWTRREAFEHYPQGHLLPIFTIGRHVERDGRTYMPLAVQVHHASADGFHTTQLIEDIRELAAQPAWVE